MPKIKSLEELREVRERARHEIMTRLHPGTKITVGMGTCGIAAGARETMRAILDELQRLEIDAQVATVGCIGMCASEPLVDIEQAGQSRISYGNVTASMVPRLIEEHLVKGQIIEEWVVGRVDK